MSYKKYKTWEESFNECNKSIMKHKREMAMTNKLFPREDGKLWVNWIGLSQKKRNKVYEDCYNTN